MCKNYKYVAIGGLVFHVKKSEYPLIRKMVDYAADRGVKVHGLGFTKTRELPSYRFYSVDSASWVLSAGIGGTLQIFDGQKIVSRGIDGKGRKKDLQKMKQFNLVEWVKYQSYMDTKGW